MTCWAHFEVRAEWDSCENIKIVYFSLSCVFCCCFLSHWKAFCLTFCVFLTFFSERWQSSVFQICVCILCGFWIRQTKTDTFAVMLKADVVFWQFEDWWSLDLPSPFFFLSFFFFFFFSFVAFLLWTITAGRKKVKKISSPLNVPPRHQIDWAFCFTSQPCKSRAMLYVYNVTYTVLTMWVPGRNRSENTRQSLPSSVSNLSLSLVTCSS